MDEKHLHLSDILKKYKINYFKVSINKKTIKYGYVNENEKNIWVVGINKKPNKNPNKKYVDTRYCFETCYMQYIIVDIIRIKDLFYINNKYKLYLILKKILNKDLSRYMIELIVNLNNQTIIYNVERYNGLGHHFRYHIPNDETEIINFKNECMNSLFKLCGFDKDLIIKN